MARRRNIDADDHLFVGEDKSLMFTIVTAAGATQDITGWTLSWMLKANLTDLDASASLTKTTSSGITLTTPTSGICTVSIADTDTDSLAAGLYYHELKRTTAGSETILSYGTCLLQRSVHRS